MSASLLSKSHQLVGLSSSLVTMDEEVIKLPQNQGIVSILSTRCESTNTRSASSLRRTLSADMSSKKWLSQHGFSPMKKIASSEEFSHCVSEYSSSSTDEDEESEEEEEKKWNGGKNNQVEEKENDAQLDIWSLIVSQNKRDKEQDQSAAPYIHPLVKRSASTLSEKSLEVCTESLGSETGSDGFSSYPSSEMGDVEDEPQQQQQQQQQQRQGSDYEDVRVVKYNFDVGKKLPLPSFPPPLPSLSSRRDGPSLRMMPHRENGRLVLEAVSVSAQNNFKAERQDGRLVLTFVNESCVEEEEAKHNQQEVRDEGEDDMEEYFEQNFEDEDDQEYYYEEDDETEDEEEEEEEEEERGICGREIEIMMEQAPKMSSGLIKHHRLALMINKSASLAARNPTWPHKYNEVVKFEEEVDQTPIVQSLPPVGRLTAVSTAAAAAASFNAYDYCWRAKPTAAQAMEKNSSNKYIISKNNSSIIANNDEHLQEVVVIKGKKADYIVPNLKGCKEHRRSLFWEPFCIATS